MLNCSPSETGTLPAKNLQVTKIMAESESGCIYLFQAVRVEPYDISRVNRWGYT